MSYKIGKNHDRNVANRKKKVKYPTLRVVIPLKQKRVPA